jgi:hypothetical protein
MKEKWIVIPNYKGLYEVSNYGNIKSLPKKWYAGKNNNSIRKHNGKILKPRSDSNGYYRVALYKNNNVAYFSIHRLVLLAFYGSSDLQCNHKNGIKTDNRLNNLEYCTGSYNCKHSYEIGLANNQGENHPYSKFTNNIIIEIRKKYIPYKYPLRKIAKEYNVTKTTIRDIVKRKTWQHI